MTVTDRVAARRTPSLDEPVPPPDERRQAGKERRRATPRSSHAGWAPPSDRPDPVEVLVESNRTRVPELVPIRYGRMLASPFAFLRGSATLMALDLAHTPTAGIEVQLCGDAHLANFGVFATPERRLVFDLNDFDETLPGPFEWDVKRLAASVVVAGRSIGCSRRQARAAALSAATAYRSWMARYAGRTHLEIWYASIDAERLIDLANPSDRRTARRRLTAARAKDHMRALAKLTEVVDGRRRIVEDPPLVVRRDDPAIVRALPAIIDGYRATLRDDHLALFDSYRLVDVARKVVGVGSVGTRCWIALFQGPNGGPLFLQVKEAVRPAPAVAGLPEPLAHHGQRVVVGQRMLQAASDILLGWTTHPDLGFHYYVRQLWDAKGSADIESMSPAGLALYAGACGWALARAHARTGDAKQLTGYLGQASTFDDAVADFAEAYADQTERDHAALRRAADAGLIPVEEG